MAGYINSSVIWQMSFLDMTERKERQTVPKYLKIYTRIQSGILNGDLAPGERLPSFSELRAEYGAMPATAERAYARLEREKLVVRKARRGVFVAPPELARTGMIGFVSHPAYPENREVSPGTQAVLEGVREGCHEQGNGVLLANDHGAPNLRRVDGLILHCDKLEFYTMGIPSDFPHVLLGQQADGITTVSADDFEGARIAVSHLVERGHQRIACLMEELQDLPMRRAAGYQLALQQAGIEIHPGWLRQVEKVEYLPAPADTSSSYLEWGRRNMRAWLDSDWHHLGCTALIVQNDHAAIGVMQILQEEGISVPDQVSVIGFDGTNSCDLVRPRLTSIRIPFYEMGREAVRALREQIENGAQAPRSIILPVKLREGSSVVQIK